MEHGVLEEGVEGASDVQRLADAIACTDASCGPLRQRPRQVAGYNACMAQLLLNLRHVPHDEADDIRELLDEHGVEWYETRPGRWGISFAGIWLRHDQHLPKARELLDEYQMARRKRAFDEQRRALAAGEVPTIASTIRREPLRFILAVGGILLMLGLVALPVFLLSR